MRHFLYLSGLLAVTHLLAATPLDNSVLANPVATQYLAQMVPTLPSLEINVQQAILSWFNQEPELVQRLVKQDDTIQNYKEEHQANNAWLIQKNITNLSPKSNYHLICPTAPDYLIKISGPSSRYMNTLVANDKWPTTLNPDDAAHFKKATTYQTVSSLVTYALCVTYAQKNPLSMVYLPRTYVLTTSNDPLQAYTDQNCVIVQERLILANDEQRTHFMQQLNESHVHELIKLIINCGIWSLSYDNINFFADGRIVLTDLEQPNVCNPLKGFYPLDAVQWRRNTSAGFADLKKLIDEHVSDAARKNVLLSLIEHAATMECASQK